jgi:DNA-binding XRE family transcriptional regulator
MTKKSTDWAPWEKTRARYSVDDELYANARAQIDAEITGYQLAQLRKELGITQTQLAKLMGVSQARVSDIERGDLAHAQLSTVSAYIEALGGHVRIVADLGDRTVDLRGWDTTAA